MGTFATIGASSASATVVTRLSPAVIAGAVVIGAALSAGVIVAIVAASSVGIAAIAVPTVIVIKNNAGDEEQPTQQVAMATVQIEEPIKQEKPKVRASGYLHNGSNSTSVSYCKPQPSALKVLK
eukprot:TRINITY_DN12896_c0_g1_i1.p1 TRINITY_DN12896_c0_g1~~TRINITY_DN12896_c0_g1_i1.p1  ORF type:complete len:124 (-),score=21.90 TRINITY_DN12896_c0_g1_i1:163-534(-)